MFRLVTSSAIIALLTAPALADVTPAEVWENYQAYMRLSGLEVVSAEVSETGNGLKVSDLRVNHLSSDELNSIEFDHLTFSKTGGSDVRVEGPSSVVGTIDDNISMNLTVTGMDLIASGTPDEVNYQSDGDRLKIGFEFEDEGDETNISGVVEPEGYALEMTVSTGDMDKTTATSTFEKIAFSMNVTGFDGPEAIGMTGSFADIKGSTDVTVPAGGNMVAPDATAAAIKAGGTRSSKVDLGPFEMAMRMSGMQDGEEGAPQIVNAQLGFDSASSNSTMDENGVSQTGMMSNLTMGGAPAGDELMLMTIAKLASEFSIPLSQSDEAQKAELRFEMGDLSLNEDLWNTFDPQAVFAREPSNLLVDLSANLKLDRSIMEIFADLQDSMKDTGTDNLSGDDEDNAKVKEQVADAELDDANPFHGLELVDLTINEVDYSALGASLSAKGALDFTQGMETPEGEVELRFSNIAEVISQFAQAGIIEADEAMSAQMAIGMFAVPAEDGAPGEMKTVIGTSGGNVSVNGMQMP